MRDLRTLLRGVSRDTQIAFGNVRMDLTSDECNKFETWSRMHPCCDDWIRLRAEGDAAVNSGNVGLAGDKTLALFRLESEIRPDVLAWYEALKAAREKDEVQQ